MISEAGLDPRFLDISQLGNMGMANKIAYCENITMEFRQGDKMPFLKLALTDVNGRAVTGYWWNAEQLMGAKFQWAVGHLVEIECSPEFERSLEVSGLRELDTSLNEVEILKTHFRRKLANLESQTEMLSKLVAQFFKTSVTHTEFLAALNRKDALVEIKNSRHPDICEGVLGGRIVLLMGLTTNLVYASPLYSLTTTEAQNALASLMLYQCLCARFQPLTAKSNSMWKLQAIGYLSEIMGSVGTNADDDILDTITNMVLELLGLSECATKAGNMLKKMMATMVELSKLGHYLSGIVGDVGAVVDGVTFIG